MSFQDYVKYREEWNFGHSTQVHDVYLRLLEEPSKESIESHGAIISEGSHHLWSQQELEGDLWQLACHGTVLAVGDHALRTGSFGSVRGTEYCRSWVAADGYGEATPREEGEVAKLELARSLVDTKL